MNSEKKRTAFTQTNVKSGFELVTATCQKTNVIPANKLGAIPRNVLNSKQSVFSTLLKGPLNKSQIIKNSKESFR